MSADSWSEHDFVVPGKKIRTAQDMELWLNCQGRKRLVDFVKKLNNSVTNRRLTDSFGQFTIISKLVTMLKEMEGWIEKCPPNVQGSRFGNLAFRDWQNTLQQNVDQCVSQLLPAHLKGACVELTAYLSDSFGNASRIDYGTGHETCFVLFLCCMDIVGLFSDVEVAAIVCVVFDRYINLCRRLQTTYMLEPAGSHGAWCLDDFQLLPFYWGSSQLIGSAEILPSMIPDAEVAEEHKEEYMFMACLHFINTVKKGPFAEHSSQLWNISSVNSWSTINRGLLTMYLGEVIGRLPVVRHFLFGSLISFDADM